MKKILPLFVFIDACGWEILKNRSFLPRLAPVRRRLESVFGYSSACIPSILSGKWPEEHRNWCYFVYDPKNSPFKFLKKLSWLPKWITSRRKFRRLLSKYLKRPLKFRGYFDLYNIPFEYISLFDFSEKRSPLQPNGMNSGLNIFDYLEMFDVAYHVSDPAKSEFENYQEAKKQMEAEAIDFAYVYWPDLDGMLHMEGNQSPRIQTRLDRYETWISDLVNTAYLHYEQVQLYVFSDHGMANCDALLDLRKEIEPLGLEMGRDFAVVYDSTMARFWFFNDKAKTLITSKLNQIPQGRIIPDEELKELGAYFPDRYFGQLIFLVKEGVLIVPSDMGPKPLKGMHGYHPTDIHSYAAILTNQPELPNNVLAIPHIFDLMRDSIDLVRPQKEVETDEPAYAESRDD